MRLVYTEQAINSMQDCLDFFSHEVTTEKVSDIRNKIIAKADNLLDNPYIGQQTFLIVDKILPK